MFGLCILFRKRNKEKLEIVLFASASRRGGRKGGLGGIPPAEPIARKISSDFFKYTPQKLWKIDDSF
ncbi:hypothetical protein A2Y83_00125 [Candidatus Falkowbacteria bacterium RBG_13_39_14]|uniref:Uncharacterized protein n=1 Tax=Candidatus Falkowbacteria bacterium RBG_13_39_14 TaxID=1797985 RepID=A0A1F5S994_9BACT|nr:MAG: hypothetical protein A2Y83_00125 [Candidatus Falkowbacteria bacterium RBG_13_39_14]